MLLRTAKSCGPDAPTLASSLRSRVGPIGLRQDISAGDGGKRARSPGSAKETVKTIACGECRAIPVYSLLLVCVLPLPSAHETAGATGTRRSPRPLWAEGFINGSGAWRGEVVSSCLESRCRHSSCPGKSAKRVFALDDPGIHQSSQDYFRRRWIAGSSPAMTE